MDEAGRRGAASAAVGEPYLARARALLPLIEDSAEAGERARRLAPAVVAALHDAGLFRVLLPRSLGGGELSPAAFVRVIETVARGDGSPAWCLCQAAGCSMVAAYLDPPIAREIFGPRDAVLAWGPGPDARAVPVDGGYRVTGTWSFASGCRHATWLGGHCPIVDTDGTPRRLPDGSVESRTMLFPVTSAAIADVWHVSGLRGTGSDSFRVADLFVPRAYSVARDDPAERRHPGPLYCFPTGSLYASGFAGVGLGLAGRALDAFVELAGEKVPRGDRRTLRDSPVVQAQVARARAQLDAARRYLVGSLEEIWDAVSATGTLTLDQRMTIRLAATWTIHQAKEVVDTVHHAAGASAIFEASAFDRRFRDMHAVTQQLQGRQAHFETVGQHLLGLPADTTFL